jgi:hypothetical protein
MLAHVLEGLSADAWRRRNGCGAVVISLAQTGVSILYIADPKIGQAASEEAARQEDVMAALAEKALHVLWQLRCHLTILVEHLSLLVGENSFYSILSAPGEGCLPARNHAYLFATSPQFFELAKQLESSLIQLFEVPSSTCGRNSSVELKIEEMLPHVLGLLAKMGRESMVPLASNVLHCIAELTWLRSNPSVGARIAGHQQACGRSMEDLLCAPLCFWPRHVDAGVSLMEEMSKSLSVLPPVSRNREWLRLALEQPGLEELRNTSELCEQGSQDVGGYLHTLEQVSNVSPVLVYSDGSQPEVDEADADEQHSHRCGMRTLAPVPNACLYKHACAGAHHRVLLRINGELLPAAARVNDVAAGTATGRPCSVTILNDILLVSLQGEATGNGSVQASSSTTIFYLPETLVVRIRCSVDCQRRLLCA